MDVRNYEVPVGKLRWTCEPRALGFNCTKELAPLKEFIGQQRAISALQFGLEMTRTGYNIYVSGLTGTGKASPSAPRTKKRLCASSRTWLARR